MTPPADSSGDDVSVSDVSVSNLSLSNTDVTVIIPAHNAGSTLARTIGSIDAQHGGGPTIIVVDDGSTDTTADIASRLGARVIGERGVGPGGARNVGIAASTTAFVAFCDADDEWPSNRLTDDLAALCQAPDTDILLGLSRYETDDERLLEGHHFDNADRCALIPHFGAATIRSELFDRVGQIDATRRNYEDYEFFQRARDLGARVVEHTRVAQTRHLIDTSTSHQNPPNPSDLLAVLRESVQRRRSQDTSE